MAAVSNKIWGLLTLFHNSYFLPLQYKTTEADHQDMLISPPTAHQWWKAKGIFQHSRIGSRCTDWPLCQISACTYSNSSFKFQFGFTIHSMYLRLCIQSALGGTAQMGYVPMFQGHFNEALPLENVQSQTPRMCIQRFLCSSNHNDGCVAASRVIQHVWDALLGGRNHSFRSKHFESDSLQLHLQVLWNSWSIFK